MLTIYRSYIPSPLGPMLALSSDDGLCALEFDSNRRHVRLDARLRRWFPPHQIVNRNTPVLARTQTWLDAYFAGENAAPPDVPLDLRGAPFELRVWSSLQTIPAGSTSSYGAVARAVGAPDASRAVGAANGANPVSIIVPCHRVIGSDGSLVGYGGGLEKKKWLLNHERRWGEGTLF